jgi:hypothetical protein
VTPLFVLNLQGTTFGHLAVVQRSIFILKTVEGFLQFGSYFIASPGLSIDIRENQAIL